MTQHAADVDRAVAKLREAIALHERHMNGTAPTTGPAGAKSQMEMMRMMREALAALQPGIGGLLGMLGMR